MPTTDSPRTAFPPDAGLPPAFGDGRYRQLFDAIHAGFCLVRVLFDDRGRAVDYRFLEVNEAFEAQTGLEDAVGHTMRTLRPDHEEHWFETYGRVARTGEAVRFENRAAALNRWYYVNAFRIGDPEERLVAILFDDITERKEAERERDALRERQASDLEAMRRLYELSTRLVEIRDLGDMLDEFLEATMAIQGADFGTVQLYDPEAEELSFVAHRGFTEEFLDHFRTVEASDGSACGRCLGRRERIVIEDVRSDPGYAPYRFLAARTGYRAVQSAPMFGRDGRLCGIFSIHFRAPHRPSQGDLRLTDLYLHLAGQLIEWKRHEEALRAAKEEAERASRAKSRFLATINHDLRTPLQAVLNVADVLEAGVGGPLTDRQRDYLSRIRGAADHMAGIVDEILEFGRSESAPEEPTLAEADVARTARRVVDMLADEARSRGAELRLRGAGSPVPVVTDERKVRQVLTNLVDNAIKHAGPGPVDVELEDDEGAVALRVRDRGPGIPADRLEDIFEPFTRLDGPAADGAEGTGLGLAICRRLARLLGGDVVAQSRPGEGSVFTFRLPRCPGA